jgi:FkbM family methyltransferase
LTGKIIKNLNNIFNYKDGFFLEVGAYDGVSFSNTINLERNLNWKGILVEPDFNQYIKCLKNRPNSIVVNAALVSEEFSKKNDKIFFAKHGTPMSKTYEENIFNLLKLFLKKLVYVNCINLSSLLSNLNITKIDLLSLDIEGNELEVLKSINFNDVNIEYICIEVWDKDKEKIFDFLKNKNYSLKKDLSEFNKNDYPNWSGNHNDYLFKKNT